MAAATRWAGKDRDLVLHYQPKVELHAGRLVGVEALARVRADGALLPPADFLESVDTEAKRRQFTDAVLDAAVAQAAAWRQSHGLIPVAVNLFPGNLDEPDLADRVLRTVVRHRLPVASLTLEVTESAVIADEDRARNTLTTLVEAGVHLALDDFGTGHSSLVRLAAYPFSELKVDRHFVSTMRRAERPLLAAVFEMGRMLGLHVVAEGVEDLATANALRAVGCETIQGYYVAKPMPADAFERWLAEEHARLSPVAEVRDALIRVRRQLAMDAVFVSEFADGDAEVGARVPLCDSYCQKVVRGVLPGIIPDATSHPRTSAMPITREAGVGSYLGVPLRRPDGSLFGTLCCISRSPRRLTRADHGLLEETAAEVQPHLASANFAVTRRGDSGELEQPPE